ncbi:MAG: Uncharacterised protein [Glaciecola sp. HTCC2999]|jgi:SEC-C motif-containing protein|nr:MAG: Uncharacterised protein [Glaciecola sp. HTCC2999]
MTTLSSHDLPIECPACALPYRQCCGPLHHENAQPISPEALMRSRYAAYVLGYYPYILETYASTSRQQLSVSDLSKSATNTRWLGLTVLDTQLSSTNQNNAQSPQGEVEFKVYYAENKRVYCLHERSVFVQESGYWRYLNGTMGSANGEIQLKRNERCVCGSNKKYKQCCLPKVA